MSWALVAIALIVHDLITQRQEMSLPTLILLGIMSLNLIVQVALTAYYFNLPFVNTRSSPLGSGRRFDVQLDGELIDKSNNRIQVSVVNLSMSGVAVRARGSAQVVDETYRLSIPSINNFQMPTTLARRGDDWIALQFSGLNLSSLFEHLKLFKYLRSVGASTSTAQSGFTLMEAMIVCAVGTIVVLGVADLMTTLTRTNQASKLLFQFQNLRNEIVLDMRNSRTWENTIADTDNTVLDCLRSSTQCTQTGLINLRDSGNAVEVRSLTPTAGFTLDGTPCNQFDAANGNDVCPIRFTITARPVCEAGTCENPVIELGLRALYSPRNRLVTVNLDKLATVVYRDPLVDGLEKSCRAMNGTFDPVTGACDLSLLTAACRAQGQYLSGLVNGVADCRNLPATPTCANGQFLRGFDADGGPVCGTL